ncbi:MAG: hypothetical protein AABW71_02800 [Nanoarchaeota archaeon]
MTNYEGKQAGEIRICYDSHRMEGKWYAKVQLIDANPKETPTHRRLLSESNGLEITLSGPNLIRANPRIIAELNRRGISTTTLRIRPYVSKR